MITLKDIQELKDRIAELEILIDKQQSTEPKVWEPKDGEDYYWLAGVGSVNRENMGTGRLDKSRVEFGNYFKTKQQAEQARDFTLVMAKLRKQTKGFKPGWGNGYEEKYSIVHSRMGWGIVITMHPGQVYFRTKEDALTALDSLTDYEKTALKAGYPVHELMNRGE